MDRERKKSTIAVIIIALLFLLMGFIEARAGISLEEQRRQREISQAYKHELEIERIRAEALVRAAKYTRNYY